MKRTLTLETAKKNGQKVRLDGWVNARRDHGKLVFVDLKDRSGIVQVVGGKELSELRPEDVIGVEGKVVRRLKNAINPKIPTGTVEVKCQKIKILAKARELPVPINTDGYKINEELRLQYRYLDLRRSRMAKNLELRHQAIKFIRDWLDQRGFIEIETPILTKSTPEGARDFIVPSRLQPGKFYALPQSPQQYKQLLMVAGFEKYYQIARCFRDEDPRADRAYGEFTQLDLEMSFATQGEILKLTEELFIALIRKTMPKKKITQAPFPVLTYEETIKKYKTDKPDLRKNKKDNDELAFCFVVDFPLFEKTPEKEIAPMHHPFTAPKDEDISLLDSDPMKVRSWQHDFVLNGFEIGGGSIRITDPKIQEKIFKILGHTPEEIKKKFGHLLEAFEFGVPPHGGIAPGIDRFLMVALGEPSLREVIAFPMTSGGRTAVMNAPSKVLPGQLSELGLKVMRRLKEGETVFQKIKDLLEANKIKYQVYKHEPVYTSEQAAEVRGTKLMQGAKALVMYADKNPIMLVVSADKKIDTRVFKKKFGVRDLRMAMEEEVERLTGVEIGAVPPFGNLFSLPLYVDKSLARNKEISFNAGLHTKSIKMGYRGFVKVARPTINEFSQ